jgi:hypothetical protein
MSREITNPELYDHVTTAVLSARERVAERLQAKHFIPSQNDFPELDRFPSGWPKVTHTAFSGPPNYSRLFGRQAGDLTPYGFADVTGMEDLLAFARGDQRLRRFIGRPDARPSDPIDADAFDIVFASLVFGLLDHVIHVAGLEFSKDDLREPYAQLEQALLKSTLPIELWIPLALTPLDVDKYELGPDVSVQRIPDDLQLARVPSSIFGGAVHECVLEAATHALVATGWKISNETYWLSIDSESLVREPPEVVTRFFTALRLAGVETGWAQIFLRPVGWSRRWKASLPTIAASGLARRYPPEWDNYAWLRMPEAVDDRMSAASEFFSATEELPERLRLALTRLDAAMLREHEEDAVVDLLIALEAAVGDRSPTEMTHKLSLRVAALLAHVAGRPAATTFSQMKKMYKYRSEIVHGGNTEKARQYEDDGSTVEVAPLAAELTRQTLAALVHEPRWRRPQAIDDDLLLKIPNRDEQEREPDV